MEGIYVMPPEGEWGMLPKMFAHVNVAFIFHAVDSMTYYWFTRQWLVLSALLPSPCLSKVVNKRVNKSN